MKLYISENIKRLRQKKNLTQEQLAETLGVSFQSVSRWETSVSYPDIELIPEIAAFFEVSTDILMGVEKATMAENLEKDKKILRTGTFETHGEYLSFLEEMHRKYPHDAETLVDLIYAISSLPERTEEMQRYIREYFDHPDAEKNYKDQLTRLLVASEKEENLAYILDLYGTECDLSREALLRYRYWNRNEDDRANKYKQLHLYHLICDLLHELPPNTFITPPSFNYASKSEDLIKRKLFIINMLAKTENMDPISGDGEPDLWFGHRLAYGFHLAGNYALSEKTEEAFASLESVVSLYEKFYSMPEGTVLTFRCPELNLLRATFRYGVRNPDYVLDFSENLYRCMRSDETFFGVDMMYNRKNGDEEYDHNVECPVWDIVPLTDREEWSCFDSIREDKRFEEYIKRMKKFIVPVSPD